MAASDGALLALIVDDEHALLVLAAWAALELPLAGVGAVSTLRALNSLTQLSDTVIAAKLQKLRAARVLVDGGISDLADKLLQSKVQTSIGAKRK